MKREYVAQVLKDRLKNRDGQFLDLTMKNGDKISIDDCFGYYVYFNKIGEGTGAKDFDELVDIVMNHPAKQEEVRLSRDKYFEEQEPKLRSYFSKYFEGKEWEEIRQDEELYERWGSYSDWHKDVYGFRPRAIVCGTRV